MKNSEKPAFSRPSTGQNETFVEGSTGLTKRELFFKDILCAFIQRNEIQDMGPVIEKAQKLTSLACTQLDAPVKDNGTN